MANQSHNNAGISVEWLLRQIPAVSFFCENDPQYTMRILIGGSGRAFGYDLDDFIDNRSYFAASATHPEDLDVVDAHAEFAVTHPAPAVSRFRLIQADSSEVQIVIASRAVRNHSGEILGLAGTAIDLSCLPMLKGASALLSKPPEVFNPRPPVASADYRNGDWLIGQLPVFNYFVEDDEDYTVRLSGGSLEELLGYDGKEFVDAKPYKASTTVYPPDQHFGDALVTAASEKPGTISAARERLVHREGHTVPVLAVARGAMPEGGKTGAAGFVLDLSYVEGLQGSPGLLIP